MIPQKHEGGVQVDGLTGERSHFTIKPNGKAFRTLIDGLYSNKIQAVIRELWSNAADSHIEAGTPDLPFKSDIPTTMDPTFRVRDFGVGLSHQGVMKLYTTIFESTKEETNEQTGMLGLGPKSPFAYTDTFSVISYSGTEKRVYVANIEADGVPAITHLSTLPCDEPKGIEVSFPVVRNDISTFVREAQWISMGFKVKPIVSGMTIAMPTPRLSGKNWAIYPANSFPNVEARSLVRQGVACYPNSTLPVLGLGYGWISIVDVPIGTCDVTASRESLQYTPQTRERITAIVKSVSGEIIAQIQADVAKAKTRREKALVYAEYNGVLPDLKGSTLVSLMDEPTLFHPDQGYGSTTLVLRRPGDTLEVASQWNKASTRSRRRRWLHSEEVNVLDKVTLWVDDGVKLLRKTQRIRENLGDRDYIVQAEIDMHTGRDVATEWVVACWELKPNQVRKLSDLPDPGPAPKVVSHRAKKVLAPGQYWLPSRSGVVESVYGGYGHRSNYRGWPRELANAQAHLSDGSLKDVKRDEILYVTPLQAQRMGLPESMRFDKAIEAELAKQAKNLPVDKALALIELYSNLGSGTEFEVVRDQFFSHLKSMDYKQATETIAKARYAKIDVQNAAITASVQQTIRLLTATYPLLFGRPNKSAFENYIKQVQAASAATIKEVQPA